MKTAENHIVKTEKRWKMDRKEKNVKNASESKNEEGNEWKSTDQILHRFKAV